ncbi:carbonic anhydrase [Hyphomicrobium sp.]|jgi:carbonic anhydrase|uniref:carbonic anhydrase n=1 Tax=Hyphomicrobium sp. TaxID=82 RepID=UPI002CFED544|nr:carbonic anhydrase [Hyphomicrobium sp.]HVZ04896.1 carbonic anhydrase [Hyphomicrobium sp.]
MKRFPEALADRYRRFKFRYFAPNAAQYEQLATRGQNPDTMVISCCDSRVDPETIFSAMPGELFVLRNIANLVPPYETGGNYHGVSSAIEFAVLNLDLKHLITIGHSGCGGIKAAWDQNAAVQTEAQFISRWMSMLEDARLAVLASNPNASPEEKQRALELAGIQQSLKNLRTFPFVREKEEAGKLQLHGAHFDIKTGTLSVFDNETGAFQPL